MSDIRQFVINEPLFDMHEHQNGYSMVEGAKGKLDYQAFLGYAGNDLATAAGGASDLSTPEAFFRTWSCVRTTGYGQATELACKTMLGIDLNLQNAEAITQALRQWTAARTGVQIYEDFLKMANLCGAMSDECWDSPTKMDFFTGREHPASFRHALRCDGVIGLSSRQQVQSLEKALDRSLQRLSDIDHAMDDYAERAREAGHLGAFKCGLAYGGPLVFESSSYAVAEEVFDRIMQGRSPDCQPLRSYLFHRFVQRAREFDLPVQVHTGYLAGNWGNPEWGNPTPLIPVFQRYRNVRFDLFHAGWPYWEIMGAIGKSFPNVYLDLCWAWCMNPAGTERMLGEWLTVVPHNRIFGFGGDSGTPYPVIGYAMQARRGIANVLERKLASGEYDRATAEQVARRIMNANAHELYPTRETKPK